MSTTAITTRIETAFEFIWDREPAEVRRLRKGEVTGSFGQCLSPVLYSEAWTREIITTLLTLRSLGQAGKLDARSLGVTTGAILENYAAFFAIEGCLPETAELTREVAAWFNAAPPMNEQIDVLEQVVRYIGRVNFWVEELIPWGPLSRNFKPAGYENP